MGQVFAPQLTPVASACREYVRSIWMEARQREWEARMERLLEVEADMTKMKECPAP